MLDSVVANGHTFDECKELLKNCKSVEHRLAEWRVGGLIDYD